MVHREETWTPSGFHPLETWTTDQCRSRNTTTGPSTEQSSEQMSYKPGARAVLKGNPTPPS